MKKIVVLFVIILALGCGSNKATSDGPSNLQAKLDKKNRGEIPLLLQIRKKPGIILKNGVPALQRNENSLSPFGNAEPLYVLNNVVIGNSFASIDELVVSYMVKKIEVLKGADASFYGSRGANGIIKITTFSGEEDKVEEN